MQMEDLTHKKFDRWRVISRAENTPQGQAQWLCRCKCGNKKVIKSILLRRGISKSCGCLRSELLVKRNTRHGHNPAGKPSPTYVAWFHMVQRCTNKNDKDYEDYGGRGIAICEKWLDFKNFLADMGERPAGRRISIGRKRNDEGYCSDNCRWETDSQQSRNRRNNRLITHNGETRCIADWADIVGVPATVIYTRLSQGWGEEKALTTPVRPWGPGKKLQR